MSESFRYDTEAGVATITWDQPGTSMNVLTEDGVRELDACVDRALADPDVKAAIITSAKADFAGGMDLRTLATLKAKASGGSGAEGPAATLFGFVMALHGVLRKIETAGADPKTRQGGKPFVWACPGTAMGIGLEIGLACHYRIGASDRGRIGLPEIQVGLFPGAGGTTRLIRMLGLMGASEALLQGKTYPAPKAKSVGLIDEAVPGVEVAARARAWAEAATQSDAVKPWDKKGYKMPGGAPYTPQGFQMFLGGVAMTHGKSQGAYPAIKAMLSAVYEGALVDFDTALRIEARWFTSVLMDPTSEAMIRSLFVNKQALEKGAVRPKDIEPLPVRKLGVLGAGMMGAAIAQVSAEAGIEVVLIDRDAEAAGAGRDKIDAWLGETVAKRRMDETTRQEVLSRVHATADYAALKGADLIVEAVFEDPRIKADVTAKAEAAAPEAIFATNTSTLPITDLARASARPEGYIGIHFFSPVQKMLLVEIIKGRATGDRAVAKALDFVRQLKKTPIVVNDARFFYANRCILPYVNEGVRMVAEGVAPPLIESAAKQMGMPLGPLQLVDETSLELGHKIATATRAAMGDAYPESPADDVLRVMVEENGRLGRKAKAGFYAYSESGKRQGFWPALATHYPPAAEQPDLTEVQHRLMMAQALEAVRALEEGVLMDIREGDVGAILGWGFAPWSGGPLSWLDMLGAAQAVAIAEDLARRHGPRFEPPAMLRDLAAKGERFYARHAAAPQAA